MSFSFQIIRKSLIILSSIVAFNNINKVALYLFVIYKYQNCDISYFHFRIPTFILIVKSSSVLLRFLFCNKKKNLELQKNKKDLK